MLNSNSQIISYSKFCGLILYSAELDLYFLMPSIQEIRLFEFSPVKTPKLYAQQ